MNNILYTEIQDDFKIEMVELVRGCLENCTGCCAYSKKCKEVRELNREEIEASITQLVGYTGIHLFELFNSFITTQVNSEPLRADSFIHLANLVFELTNNKSRVIAISHGLRYNNRTMIDRLQKVVDLMEKNRIPLFVLSFDLARNNGKYRYNYEAYLQTLGFLKGVSNKVEVSIRGVDDERSALYIGNAMNMFREVINELGINESDIKYNKRIWVKEKGSKNLNITKPSECQVIPSPTFVEDFLPKDHKWHGLIDIDGNVRVTDEFTYATCLKSHKWFNLVA